MKILFFAAFLAMAVFANAKIGFKDLGNKVIKDNKGKQDFADVVNQVIELNAKQKKVFADAVIEDLAKTEDKKCMDDLKPVLTDTTVKYIKKIVKGEPFYQKEGKEFKLGKFIQHSKTFKTATSDKCLKSMVKGIGKAVKYGVTVVFTGIVMSG